MRREVIAHLCACSCRELLKEQGLQVPIREYGTLTQRFVPNVATGHLLCHVRALMEEGDITDRFRNELVGIARA